MNEEVEIAKNNLVLEKMKELQQGMEQINKEFQNKLKYDQHKEKIIDQLHREVQEYKNGLLQKLLRPVFLDLIHEIDDLNKLLASYENKEPSELDPIKLLKLMKGIPSGLEDVLSRHGVEPLSTLHPSSENKFTPLRQKALKTKPTPEKVKDKTISQTLRKGYEWEGKILRQEFVEVYLYQPQKEEQLQKEEQHFSKLKIEELKVEEKVEEKVEVIKEEASDEV